MANDKDDKPKKANPSNMLDQIKKGVDLKPASSRELASKKISVKEQKELDIAEKLNARNKSLQGDDGYDSDTSTSTDSDDEYDDLFSTSPASPQSKPKANKSSISNSSSSGSLFSGSHVNEILSKHSSSPKQSSDYSSDSDWEDEKEPKSHFKQSEIPKSTETAEEAKSRNRQAKEALEKSFKQKISTSTISTPTSKLTPELEEFVVQLGKLIHTINNQVKETINQAASVKRSIAKNNYTEKSLLDLEVKINAGIYKLKEHLASINEYIESNGLKSEQALKDQLKIFENSANRAILVMDLSDEQVKQINKTLHNKVQDQKVKVENLKADAMSVLLQLGAITKSVHESAEKTIKISQSIAISISNPKRTESTLNDIKSKTNDAIYDLETRLAKLKDFVQATTLKNEKDLNTGFKRSKDIVDLAENAIKLAKAEIALIRIAIARDQAMREAKNAGAILQKKHMLTEIAKQAAALAHKKFGAAVSNKSEPIENKDLRAAEVEKQRAQEEARVKEAESLRLQEEERQAQAAIAQAQASIAEEQRRISELRRKRNF